ncbi:MAG TPA: hypothetical protein VKK79_21645 [Candidatus Lokiarchaeia archaeon]|nr:hypothetical protein [Candidatus Lokiarchaeia archaeon]
MPSPVARRARFVKNLGISLLITSGIIAVPLALLSVTFWAQPQVTTLFLHYNAQYRAGDMATENVIINESIRAMLGVMDKHPTWHYTIEFQSYILERLTEEPSYRDILDMIQRQMGRGQLELMTAVYSSQLLNAYPVFPLALSLNLTTETINRANSLYAHGNITQSRVISFQEGQYSPGIPFALERANTRIDTVVISRQQIEDLRPSSAGPWSQPIQQMQIAGRSLNLLVYDYLPCVEAGYLHGWINTQDAELIFENKSAGAYEFQVDPARVAGWESQWAALEQRGVTMMTCEEWVNHCEKVNAVEPLTYFFLPVHWGPTKYDTCFPWYGDNSGNTDDGAMLATNFRAQLVLHATTWLNDTYGSVIAGNSSAIQQINWDYANASRSMLKAMGTDTVGINPETIEREYGYSNSFFCLANCSDIIRILQWNLNNLNQYLDLAGASQFQVDLQDAKNYTSPAAFIGPTYVADSSLAAINSAIPLVISNATTGTTNATNINASLVAWDGISNIMHLQVTFPGTRQWGVDTVGCALTFAGNVNTINVGVPIADNFTAQVTRSDYLTADILRLHLPLSLGYIYLPGADANKGTAIIWNASPYQIAPLWTAGAITFETSPIRLDATFDFYLINNTSDATGLALANRINHAPPVTLSANVTQMFGYEYYSAYQTMAGGESAIHEWWQ